MANYDSTQAAFYGLKQLGKESVAWVKIIIPVLILFILATLLSHIVLGDKNRELADVYKSLSLTGLQEGNWIGILDSAKFKTFTRIISSMIFPATLFLFLMWIINIVLKAASLRWLLEGSNYSPKIGVKLGRDEGYLFLVLIVYNFLLLVPFAFLALIGQLFHAVGLNSAGSVVLTITIAGIAYIILYFFLAVKLSLWSALTVKYKSPKLISSWGVIKGCFWKVFLSYLIVSVVFMLSSIIYSTVIFLLSRLFHLDLFGLTYVLLSALITTPFMVLFLLSIEGVKAYSVNYIEGEKLLT